MDALALPELSGPAEVPSILARFALQSVRFCCSNFGVAASVRPLGFDYPFRVSGPLKYRPYCLDDPTLPLAIPSAVWFFLNGIRWSLFSFQLTPLFGFRLPLEFYPAVPSQPTAVRRLLSWASGPYST
jgi:hypothetical protein